MVALDVAEHERIVAGELQRQGAALALAGPQHGDGALVEVDTAACRTWSRPRRRRALARSRTMPADRRTLTVPRRGRRRASAARAPRRGAAGDTRACARARSSAVLRAPSPGTRRAGRGPRVHLRRLRLLRRGRRGRGRRVARQALVFTAAPSAERQDRVHVADGARRQALALAVVGAAAALELAVQPVDLLRGQRGQRHRAERGRDVQADVLPVAGDRRRRQAQPGGPLVEVGRRAAACSGRPARRARRRPACRAAPPVRPSW